MPDDEDPRTKKTVKHGNDEGFIPPHGGYEKLLSFQKARIVYDGTVHFCDRWIDQRSRTHDQMIQAARASLEELLEDYRDYLRVRDLAEWSAEHPYTARLRELNRESGANYDTFRKGIEHADPAIAANVLIGLIRVTTYLLDQQVRRLEQDFLNEGGLRERMTQARLQVRARQQRESDRDSGKKGTSRT